MSPSTIKIIAALVIGLVSIGSARADGLAIKGTVTGTDGKPLTGAEVRAERLDHKKDAAVVATTNAKGQYEVRGLALAPYKVTTIVNKVPKSVASIKTRSNAWVRADFDLRGNAKVATKKRMVWVSGETGSHIGSGHWESVDENSNGNGASSMERVDGALLRSQPNLLNPSGGVSGPSH
jgi:hypothetical protein